KGSGSVDLLGVPVCPSGGTVAAEAACVVTAVAASAAAPFISLRRSKACLLRKVSGGVMISSPIFFWEKIMCPQIRHKAGDLGKTTSARANFAVSDRVPAEDVGRTVELVERGLQRRHCVLCNRLRRPAFAAVHRAQRTRLTHQENLVH